jgi:hypothetical protein
MRIQNHRQPGSLLPRTDSSRLTAPRPPPHPKRCTFIRTRWLTFPCTPTTYASWANPIEAHFGPLRQFTVANSNHHNHTVQTLALHAYLRWRNGNARHPDVLAAQRKERARIRSERHIRWGGRQLAAAA